MEMVSSNARKAHRPSCQTNHEDQQTVSPDRIFLDNNATTGIDPSVAHAISVAFQQPASNPASQHSFGRDARRTLENATDRLATLAGLRQSDIHADRIVITSGGTEANNLAISGIPRPSNETLGNATLDGGSWDRVSIAVSAIEHPSVLAAAEQLKLRGCRVFHIAANADGQICLDSLDEIIETARRSNQPLGLVSVMMANNETGVLQPIERVVQRCQLAGIPVHSDAVQAFGKIPLHFSQIGLSAMTVTAHKLHGPVGVGALITQQNCELTPQLFGGFQQLGIRPGTEPVALVVGFAEAADIATKNLEQRATHLEKLRLCLETTILESVRDAVLIGQNAPRLPHTASIAFPGRNRQSMQMALDMRGIACGTGSACASGSNQPSSVLTAMGLPFELIDSTLRFSVSFDQSLEKIQSAAKIVSEMANRTTQSRNERHER
jgi:cysteine desulfurase